MRDEQIDTKVKSNEIYDLNSELQCQFIFYLIIEESDLLSNHTLFIGIVLLQ